MKSNRKVNRTFIEALGSKINALVLRGDNSKHLDHLMQEKEMRQNRIRFATAKVVERTYAPTTRKVSSKPSQTRNELINITPAVARLLSGEADEEMERRRNSPTAKRPKGQGGEKNLPKRQTASRRKK